MYLGIDFGTTYSTLSIYVDNDQETGLLPALAGSRGIPTLIRYERGIGGWLYGDETDIEHYPNDTIKDIKAKIRNGGDIKETVATGGRDDVPLEELLRGYLAWLILKIVDEAKASSSHDLADEDIEGIAVTVPCGFAGTGMTRSLYGHVIEKAVIDAYQNVIRGGVELAKIGRPKVIIREEPVAAAIAYLKDPKFGGRNALEHKRELNILVADLGGGTFDVTVVKCKGFDRFQICQMEGDLHLGGNDFDETLLQLLISKIRTDNPTYTLTPDKHRLNLLQATKAKEKLSEKKLKGELRDTTVRFTDHDGKVAFVTRQEFEDATRTLLQRAMDLIRRCVDRNGGIGSIDKIVLVGGGCRMPQIRNGINNLYPTFGDTNIVLYNPSYSIANGAAYCAAMGDVTVEMIDDMASCAYGVLMYRTADENGKGHDPFIQNKILKGMHFGSKEAMLSTVKGVHPASPKQTGVLFQVFESTTEERAVALNEDNVKWNGKRFEVKDERFNSTGLEVEVPIPAEFRGREREYELEAKMTLNRNGILTLEVYHDDILVKSNSRQL